MASICAITVALGLNGERMPPSVINASFFVDATFVNTNVVHARGENVCGAHGDHHVREQRVAGDVLEQTVEVAVVEGEGHDDFFATRQREFRQHARRQVVGVHEDGAEVVRKRVQRDAQLSRRREPTVAATRPQRNLRFLRRICVAVLAGVITLRVRPGRGARARYEVQVGGDRGVVVVRPKRVPRQVHGSAAARLRFRSGGRRLALAREEGAEDGGRRRSVLVAVHGVGGVLEVANEALGARVARRDVHGDLQALHRRAEGLARAAPEQEGGLVAVQREIDDENSLVGS
jgi:hypothetical protein